MTGQVPRAALVTGAARRIGRAIALGLHEAGYAVAIQANRSVTEAETLRDEIVRAGGRAAVVRADLSDHAAVAALVPAALNAIGPLTLLVNNAATFEPDAIGSLDAKRFDRQFYRPPRNVRVKECHPQVCNWSDCMCGLPSPLTSVTQSHCGRITPGIGRPHPARTLPASPVSTT